MPLGANRAGIVSQVGDEIPGSVVSRTDDDSFTQAGTELGTTVSTTETWPTIQARISANTNADTANIQEVFSDDTYGETIASVDISSLTSGDVVTFEESDLSRDLDDSTRYGFTITSFSDAGYLDSPPYAIESNDGVLAMEDGTTGSGGTQDRAYAFVEIGNINL